MRAFAAECLQNSTGTPLHTHHLLSYDAPLCVALPCTSRTNKPDPHLCTLHMLHAPGAVFLVERGNCSFTDKYQAAVTAGGSGMILFDDLPGELSLDMQAGMETAGCRVWLAGRQAFDVQDGCWPE